MSIASGMQIIVENIRIAAQFFLPQR